jgi:hypothetical protein
MFERLKKGRKCFREFKEEGCKVVDWIHLAQDRGQ